MLLGALLGSLDGACDGELLGLRVGKELGTIEGSAVGCREGLLVGVCVGPGVGQLEIITLNELRHYSVAVVNEGLVNGGLPVVTTTGHDNDHALIAIATRCYSYKYESIHTKTTGIKCITHKKIDH